MSNLPRLLETRSERRSAEQVWRATPPANDPVKPVEFEYRPLGKFLFRSVIAATLIVVALQFYLNARGHV